MKSLLCYTLPLGIILLHVAVVNAMVAISRGNRPERKATIAKGMLVDANTRQDILMHQGMAVNRCEPDWNRPR